MRLRLVGIGLIIVVLVLLMAHCSSQKKIRLGFINGFIPAVKDESIAVNIGSCEITVQKPGAPPAPIDLIRTPRHTKIIVDKTGHVSLQQKQLGFVFEPGVSLAMSDKLSVGLDAQILYVYRFGLVIGNGFVLNAKYSDLLRPYIAVSYDLPFKYTKNTSVFVGYTTKENIISGLRVRF